MKTAIEIMLTLGLFALVTTTALSQEKKSGLTPNQPAKPEWQNENLSRQPPPRSIGILVINYEDYLFPEKLSTGIARSNMTEYMSYQPPVASDSIAQLITQSIVAQVKAIDARPITLHPLALTARQSVRDGLDRLKTHDMVLVLAVKNPRASLVLLADGQKLAVANMPMDFVLLSRERTPLMTYNIGSLETLKTIGELEVGYDKAQPFREQVSYRYTLDALVKATAPVVVDVVKAPFLAALRTPVTR